MVTVALVAVAVKRGFPAGRARLTLLREIAPPRCHPEAAWRPKDPTRNPATIQVDGPGMLARSPYYVYIVTGLSLRRVMYIGVTSNLAARIEVHRRGAFGGFTARYQLWKLVYAEAFTYVRDAIAREKQLKGWRRSRKIALIESGNPHWGELAVPVYAARGPWGPSGLRPSG